MGGWKERERGERRLEGGERGGGGGRREGERWGGGAGGIWGDVCMLSLCWAEVRSIVAKLVVIVSRFVVLFVDG